MPVFLHTFQRENIYAKLHENAPFGNEELQKNFLGERALPPPQTPPLSAP